MLLHIGVLCTSHSMQLLSLVLILLLLELIVDLLLLVITGDDMALLMVSISQISPLPSFLMYCILKVL